MQSMNQSVDSWKSNSYIYNFPDGRKAYGYQARHCSCCMGPSPAPLNTTPRGSFRKGERGSFRKGDSASGQRYDPQRPPKRRPPTPDVSDEDANDGPYEYINNPVRVPTVPDSRPNTARHHRPLAFAPTLPDDRDNYYNAPPPMMSQPNYYNAAPPQPQYAPAPPPQVAPYQPMYAPAPPPPVPPLQMPLPPPPPPPAPVTPCPRDHNRAPPGDRFCTHCGVPVLSMPEVASPLLPALPIVADTTPRYYNTTPYLNSGLNPPQRPYLMTPTYNGFPIQPPPQPPLYNNNNSAYHYSGGAHVCLPCGGSGVVRDTVPFPASNINTMRCTCSDKFVCPTCHGATRTYFANTSPLYHH